MVGGIKESWLDQNILSVFFFELSLFSIIAFFCFFIFYWGLVLTNWNVVDSFFSYFESYSPLSTLLTNSVFSAFNDPSLGSISIIVVFLVGFFYVTQMIRDKGYIYYETEGIESKYFKSLFIILASTLAIFLPYLYFIYSRNRGIELYTDVFLLFFNFLVGMILFNLFTKINQNYNAISALKSSIKKGMGTKFTSPVFLKYFPFIWKQQIANSIIFLMFLCLFFSIVLHFNLISIIYIEVSLFVEYYIFCSVTKMPDGPVNILLKDNKTTFNDAYIFEDSEKGNIFIILKENILKKIHSSSILYIEPSLEDNDNSELINEHILPNEITLNISSDDETDE